LSDGDPDLWFLQDYGYIGEKIHREVEREEEGTASGKA
jgi:hypothetical protein